MLKLTCVIMFPSSKAMTEAGMARPSLNICVIPAFVPIKPMDGKPDRAIVKGCLAGALATTGLIRLLQIHLWPDRKGRPCIIPDPDMLAVVVLQVLLLRRLWTLWEKPDRLASLVS